MSDGLWLASIVMQLALAVFLIFLGVVNWLHQWRIKDMPFGEYCDLQDCINKNWNKRDPKQYCMKIREKVETARERRGY